MKKKVEIILILAFVLMGCYRNELESTEKHTVEVQAIDSELVVKVPSMNIIPQKLSPTLIPTNKPTSEIYPSKLLLPTATLTPYMVAQKMIFENFKVLQQGEFPTGCESVAAVALLNYLGYEIDKGEFINKYLDQIASIEEFYKDKANSDKFVFDYYFVGNPASENGSACNAPVIVKAIQKYFDELGEKTRYPENISGSDFDYLIEELEQGYPVLIWLSIDLTNSARKHSLVGVTYYTSRHTGVLIGYNYENHTIYFADSISGEILEWPIEKAKEIYNKYKKQAVVIR